MRGQVALFCFALSLPMFSQFATTSATLTADPGTNLRLAIDANGLDYSGAKSWHIKVSYDQFDEDGDNIHSGTFEEYYAGPKKYKQIYADDTFKQTNVATEAGLYRIGDPSWAGPLELQVENEVLRPLHRSELNTKNTKLDMMTWTVGNASLPCVVMRLTNMVLSDNGLTKFCFDHDTVRLRYTRGLGWDETVYNNLVQFQGRYVAKDITVHKGGKEHIAIHVDVLEALSTSDQAELQPLQGSTRVEGRMKMASGLLVDEYLLQRGELHLNGDHGKVTVHFVVGKDGRVIEADALDGPSGLRKSVLKTMREYTFRPVLVLGEPVEVEGAMTFAFQ